MLDGGNTIFKVFILLSQVNLERALPNVCKTVGICYSVNQVSVLSQAAFTDSFAKLIKFYKKVNKNNDCFCLGQRNLTALDALMV